MSNYPPYYPYSSLTPLVRVYPDPPRLHWGVVFGLSVITFGIFGMVWLLVQAYWVKKVNGSSKAFGWALAYLLLLPAMFVLGFIAGIVAVLAHMSVNDVQKLWVT